MKRKLPLMVLMFTYFISFAQFEVRNTGTDELISDGQTISFTESGTVFTADYNWKFKVTNTSSSDIYMRIFVDEMTNNDGSNFQLCFAGVCLNSITTGSGYPSTAALIAPGATNVAGNNLWNQNPSGTSQAMSWTFRFQAFDAGGFEVGTPFILNYVYDQNLSVEGPELSSVKVFPTQVRDELTVSSNQKMTAEFYNVLGKKVKQVNINSGESQINVSDLSPQLYIIRFRNDNGSTLIRKIVVE